MLGEAVNGVPLDDKPVPLSKPDCVTEPEPSPSKPEYPIKSLTVNNGLGTACLRFSKILALPISFLLLKNYPHIDKFLIEKKFKILFLSLISILSHIFFIYYVMTHHYYL